MKFSFASIPLNIAVIAVLLSSLTVSRYSAYGFYVLLCALALSGPKHAIRALSLNLLIVLLNPALFILPSESGVLRWAVWLIAALRIAPHVRASSFGFLLPLMLFSSVVAVQSFFVSPNVSISLLKLAAFSLCAATVVAAFDSLDADELSEIKMWFQSMSIAVVGLSLPTLIEPKIGFFINGLGFQGLLSHPQTFGIFLTPVSAYIFAILLLKRKGSNTWMWLLGAVVLTMMFLSKTRTAMLSLLLTLASVMMVGTILSRRESMDISPIKTIVRSFIGVAAFIILFAASEYFSSAVEAFWIKYDTVRIERALYMTRGGGIEFHWKRFLEQPLIGHGFGIDVAHGSEKKPTTFMDIPVSAATEKGFLPTAFLEEVGIVGIVFFAPLIYVLTRRVLRQTEIGMISIYFACLLVNIGESVLFSPGQLGGYLWLLIGLAATPPAQVTAPVPGQIPV